MKTKQIVLLLGLFLGKITMGQTVIKDTLYVSKHTITHLVVTEPLFMSDYGNSMIVTSNSNKNGMALTAQKEDMQIISIKARKKFKTPSNISIVTTTNIFYDIKCIYNEELVDSYYYIDPKGVLQTPEQQTKIDTVNNPESKDITVLAAQKKDSVIEKKIAYYYGDTIYYKGIAKKIYSTKTKRLKHNSSTVEKISLKLVGVYALQDKLYIKLLIYNDGTLPFHIDKWDYRVQKKGGYDYKQIPSHPPQPIYQYNTSHDKVLPNDTATKVFVFDQFALDTHQSLYIQLVEKALLRSPIIEIKNKYINNAFPLEEPSRILFNLNQ